MCSYGTCKSPTEGNHYLVFLWMSLSFISSWILSIQLLVCMKVLQDPLLNLACNGNNNCWKIDSNRNKPLNHLTVEDPTKKRNWEKSPQASKEWKSLFFFFFLASNFISNVQLVSHRAFKIGRHPDIPVVHQSCNYWSSKEAPLGA